MKTMDSRERDIVIIERRAIYDELSRTLTDYEHRKASGKDLYSLLCEIQNCWEDVITCEVN